MAKKDKNRNALLDLLDVHGRLTTAQVVDRLGVSEATARRLFARLEREGALLRTHGGVRKPERAKADYLFWNEAAKHTREKIAIGERAGDFITSGDRLFFDSGTTSRRCGVALCVLLRAGTVDDVRVVTNSLAYTDNLAQACPLTLTGGALHPKRLEVHGPQTLAFLEPYRFTKAFLGTDAIAPDGALLTSDSDTAQLARAVIARSREVFLLADGGKFGREAFVAFGSLLDPNITLITDASAPAEMLQTLRAQGATILVAPAADAATPWLP